jgi:hypothetical protein
MSPSSARTVKARRIHWAGHVVMIRKMQNAYRILVEKPVWNVHLEYREGDGG